MIWVYRMLFAPVMLLASPYFLRRMWRRGGYASDFSHRFGTTPLLPAKRPGVRRVWLQAVSVGELLAIGPLLTRLCAEAGVEVYLTTTTSTGYALAKERYAGLTIGIGYFPIDWWPCARRTWRRVEPDLVILTEGERWPEHIQQARTRGVPVVAVNARLSDRSFRRMGALRALVPALLGGITRVLASSEGDAQRFRALGFPAENIVTTGNIKLDGAVPPLNEERLAQLRGELGLETCPVLLGASTWPGEEAALLAAYRALRAGGHPARLLIVPRHAERRAEIEALLASGPERVHFRSRGAAPGPVDIAVADTTGELRALTQLGQVVFVGKSLPPHHEGQTPVEAAALGKPIVFGPQMSNFRLIARELRAAGAAREVGDAAALSVAVAALWSDAGARARMAEAALAWHQANQGALERTLAEIRAELSKLIK